MPLTGADRTAAGNATIQLFRPEADFVHSAQVRDFTNGPHGEVILATTYGLSTYAGGWSTRHVNHDNLSAGLMDDFVTAVEYDSSGNLWIGYGGGIQIFNGRDYTVVRDPELLKSCEIRALQRWGDEMWIATGNAGIHRYRDGVWTWYPPDSPHGSGFYEADSLTLDSATDTLLIATAREGAWAVTKGENDTVRFRQIAGSGGSFGQLGHVRQDPLGGAYYFNATLVAHYDTATGFTLLTRSSDLGQGSGQINDVAGGSDGALYIASDDGIYVWKDHRLTDHLDRFKGFGTVNSVRTVFTDAEGRLWFATPDEVGYYTGTESQNPVIVIETMTLSPSPSATVPPVSAAATASAATVQTVTPASSPLDGVVRFLSGFLPFLSPAH